MEIILFLSILILLLNEQTRFLAIILFCLFVGTFLQFILNNIISIVIITGTLVTYSYFKKNS